MAYQYMKPETRKKWGRIYVRGARFAIICALLALIGVIMVIHTTLTTKSLTGAHSEFCGLYGFTSPACPVAVAEPYRESGNHLPVSKDKEYILLHNQKIYGYSSTVDQTDGDPFTTANGTKVKQGIIANNCYSFGQRVGLVSGSDRQGISTVGNRYDQTYTVTDRMNSRYGCNTWDIWFPSRQEARNWGVRTVHLRAYL